MVAGKRKHLFLRIGPEMQLDRAIAVPSLRIIAAAIIFAFCYFASSILITLLISILIAFLFDPGVEWLEQWRMPRALGALIAVLIGLSLISLAGYGLYARGVDFVEDWPKYSRTLKMAATQVRERFERVEKSLSEITEAARPRERVVREVRVAPEAVSTYLLRGIGSIYSFIVTAAFVPFLVYFMLTAKRDLWHGTLSLFPPGQRTAVKHTLEALNEMIRGFLLGNIIVAGVMVVVTILFLWIMGLDYPILIGTVSGLLNLIPYLGVVLAIVPPVIVGLAEFKGLAPFIAIMLTLTFFHLIAVNVLVPKLVGKKVKLNALAVTVSLLFWGWLWGAFGLILAIPITAAAKVICDHVEDWRPVGHLLGE